MLNTRKKISPLGRTIFQIYYTKLLVSCGGGRRLADGLRKQHVRPIRLLVWDTLEDFSPLGLHTWDEDSTLHACTWSKNESVQDDGRAFLATGWFPTAGTILTLTWVLMADHVEETTDRGQCGDPGSSPEWRRCPALANLRCIETRWKKDMGGPLRTTGIARGPPLRGGLTCRVYVMPCASSR